MELSSTFMLQKYVYCGKKSSFSSVKKIKIQKIYSSPSEVVGLNGSLVLAGVALVLSVINLDWNIFHTIQSYKNIHNIICYSSQLNAM